MTPLFRPFICTLFAAGTLATAHAAGDHTGPRFYAPTISTGSALPATTVAIDDAQPTILIRYLGYGCSHCVRQIAYLNRHAEQLRTLGIRVIAFSEDDEETCKRMIEREGFDTNVLSVVSDSDNGMARRFGALRTDGDSTLDLHAAIVVNRGKVALSVYSNEPYMDVQRLINAAIEPVAANEDGTINYLLSYLNGSPVTVNIIAGPDDGIREPVDLDFNRSIISPNDLWVVTSESNGHAIALVHNAGTPQQIVRRKKDSRASHFMWRTQAIAMAPNGTFGTAENGEPGDQDYQYLFMGPTLWSSDTAIFASKYQNDNRYLASHLDMLHQSPYGLGIAHDHDNVYWVSDSYYKDITRYDYQYPHEVGGTDHRDGIIRRYSDVKLTAVERGRPAHIAMDRGKELLYFIDPGTARVLRLHTNTGTVKGQLQPPPESEEMLQEFSEVTGAVIDTVVKSGLQEPVGIDVRYDRMIVGDRKTGLVHIYDISTVPATKLGTVDTKATELLGITLGPDDHIWFVDRGASTVGRLETTLRDRISPVTAVDTYNAVDTVWFDYHNATTSQKTISVRARLSADSTPWAVAPSSKATTVTIEAGSTTRIPVVVTRSEAAAPVVDLMVTASDATAFTSDFLRAKATLVSSALRRVVINDGTTEGFDITEAVSLTDRTGYVSVDGDIFVRIADDLDSLQTALWFSGSFGDINTTDDAIISSLLKRDIEIFMAADDPLILRTDLPNSISFFESFGASFVGADALGFGDDGRRLFSGVPNDPVTGELGTMDCQLPALSHHRGDVVVPNVRLRAKGNGSASMLVRDGGTITGAVRYQRNQDYRTIMLGINPARIMSPAQRTDLLDKGLAWLEAFAPVPDTTTPTSVAEARQQKAGFVLKPGINPFSENTHVRVSSSLSNDTPATVGLYTVGGQRVAALFEGAIPAEGIDLTIDGSTLAAGTYFVIVRTAHDVSHVTLVKR